MARGVLHNKFCGFSQHSYVSAPNILFQLGPNRIVFHVYAPNIVIGDFFCFNYKKCFSIDSLPPPNFGGKWELHMCNYFIISPFSQRGMVKREKNQMVVYNRLYTGFIMKQHCRKTHSFLNPVLSSYSNSENATICNPFFIPILMSFGWFCFILISNWNFSISKVFLLKIIIRRFFQCSW